MAFSAEKTVVLVTGANRGIGFEIVKALLKASPSDSPSSGAPYHVYLGSRDLAKGKAAAASLQAEHGNSVAAVKLDINSVESIASGVSVVQAEAGRIDVLVNNAGIISEEADRLANLRACLETNVVMTLAVSDGFRPLLLAGKAAKAKRIINISSDLGSIAYRYDTSSTTYKIPFTEYRISKAALNMLTACQSFELKDEGVMVFSFNPGYTVTELSGSTEQRRKEGAWEADIPGAGCAKIIAGERDHEVGQMLEVHGTVPW